MDYTEDIALKKIQADLFRALRQASESNQHESVKQVQQIIEDTIAGIQIRLQMYYEERDNA